MTRLKRGRNPSLISLPERTFVEIAFQFNMNSLVKARAVGVGREGEVAMAGDDQVF